MLYLSIDTEFDAPQGSHNFTKKYDQSTQLLQVGYVLYDDAFKEIRFSKCLNVIPERPVSKEVQEFLGIGPSGFPNGKPLSEVIEILNDDIVGLRKLTVLEYGTNDSYLLSRKGAHLPLCSIDVRTELCYITIDYAGHSFPLNGDIRLHLYEFCKLFNIDVDMSNVHDSRYDAFLCLELYKGLVLKPTFSYKSIETKHLLTILSSLGVSEGFSLYNFMTSKYSSSIEILNSATRVSTLEGVQYYYKWEPRLIFHSRPNEPFMDRRGTTRYKTLVDVYFRDAEGTHKIMYTTKKDGDKIVREVDASVEAKCLEYLENLKNA